MSVPTLAWCRQVSGIVCSAMLKLASQYNATQRDATHTRHDLKALAVLLRQCIEQLTLCIA